MANTTTLAPTARRLQIGALTRLRFRRTREGRAPLLFVLPIAAVFVVLYLIPMVQSVYYSFTDFNGYVATPQFVGLKNYVQIWRDDSMVSALGFTLLYAVGTTVVVTVLAIPLALVLNRRFFGRNFVRAVFFFPAVPSVAVLGLVWTFILNPLGSGVINSIIGAVGVAPVPWLSDDTLAQVSVIVVAVWAQTGWHAILYLAYLQSIPSDYFEAAKIDGARRWQEFRYIALPLLVPAVSVSTLLLLTGGLKVYDLPFTLTKGGPGFATRTLTQAIIENGIARSDLGRASALAVLFLIAVGLVVAAQLAIARRLEARELMRQSRGVLVSIVMIPVACVVAVPFYYILVNTLKTQQQTSNNPLALPATLNLRNYVDVFSTLPIVQTFFNTLYVTVASILLMLLIGSMAAFGVLLGKGRFAFAVGAMLVVAFLIPGQATLVPLYRMLVGVGLVDSLEGLIIMYAAGSIFCYFLIIGYMRTIPIELFEAARIDGAGAFRIYRSVALPLIRPILVTVGVFQTMWVWNDFITPQVFISSPEKATLVLQVYSAVGQYTTNWPAFATLSVVVLVPMVIFFIVMQRHIMSGLLSGGIKG